MTLPERGSFFSYTEILYRGDIMELISISEYRSFIPLAEKTGFGSVYPLSVAQGFQSGQIYRFGSCILFRHRSNFSFFTGTPGKEELRELHDLTVSEGLKLMCSDADICGRICSMGGLELIPRDNYSYPRDIAPDVKLHEGFSLQKIDEKLFGSITGRVSPSLYWRDYEEFRRSGTGICVMCGSEPVSWAFTSAVSSTEADIGIETSEPYRHRGLTAAAAAALIGEILPGRRPTWCCQRSNLGSSRTAKKLGFVNTSECILLRRSI